MKILDTKQIKSLDAYTIEHEPIPSIDLMERACNAFVAWFTERYDAGKKIGIVCGTGNNGGDGLGIARLLKEWGYSVKVWIVKGIVPESPDFKINLERIAGKIEIKEIISDADKGLFTNLDILIDGIFGSGLSRPAQGIYEQAITCINEADVVRIAIDIPSGLMANAHSEGSVVCADFTISFQLPKLAFLLPENHQYVGQWAFVDIGLDKEFIRHEKTDYALTQRKNVRKLLRPRSTFDHKGNYGKAVLISGSKGKIGAAILAARAALRVGVGLLTVHTPGCGYSVIQTAVPEAMVSSDEEESFISEVPDLATINAVGVGPGIGQNPSTLAAFTYLLKNYSNPFVIDADGLNLLSANRELLHVVPQGSILTPHPKEFERLVGVWKDDFHKLELLKDLAKQIKGVVILKGAYSAVATHEGKVYFNSTGNPGMATGGSGDVLTGMLTGLLAQGYSSLHSALIGTYLHGLAGDIAVSDMGQEALIASDIVDHISAAYKRIRI